MEKCAFCCHGKDAEKECGRLYCPREVTIAAHHKCMQYSSKLTQFKDDFLPFGGFELRKVDLEIQRGRSLCCRDCKIKEGSASAGCAYQRCSKSYHFYCAKMKGLTSHWKNEDNEDCYRVLCSSKHEEKYLASRAGMGLTCIKRSTKPATEMDMDKQEESAAVDDVSGSSDSKDYEEEDSMRSPSYPEETQLQQVQSAINENADSEDSSGELPDLPPIKHRKRKMPVTFDIDSESEKSPSKTHKKGSEEIPGCSFPGSSQDREGFEALKTNGRKNRICMYDSPDELSDSEMLSLGDNTKMNENGRRPSPTFENQHLTGSTQGEIGVTIKTEYPERSESRGVLPYSATNSDSYSSGSEILLVIPANPRIFSAVESDVQRKMASQFTVDEKDVYFWNAITPVPLPSSYMLHYFYDIAQTLKSSNWEDLRLLLLDDTTLKKKCSEEYPLRFYSGLWKNETELENPIRKLVWKSITSDLREACSNNQYLLGVLSMMTNSGGLECSSNSLEDSEASSGTAYLSLVINNMSDPNESLRMALRSQQAIYQLPVFGLGCVKFVEFNPNMSLQQEDIKFQESILLQRWFSKNVPQLQKLIVLPLDEVFVSQSSSSPAFSAVESTLKSLGSNQAEDREHPLPIVVLIKKLNTTLVHFEPYLQALLARYTKEFECRRVVCLFHTDNETFHLKQCPQFHISESSFNIEFLSAFDPSKKPISVLIADISKK